MLNVTLARPWKSKNTLKAFALQVLNETCEGAVSFAQVGANDGVMADPIYPYLREFEWSGVMVEPHPAYFSDLSKLHAGRPNLQLVNCAVSDVAGEMELFYLSEAVREYYPDWARGCASLKRHRLIEVVEGKRQQGQQDLDADIEKVGVPVRRLDDILEDHSISALDFLLIDVEGFEEQVLESVDLTSLNLRACMVECNGSDTKNEATIARILERAGLITFRFRDDLFGMHPERLNVPLSQVMKFMNQPPL
ncbi:MAG: FkbM family methyltransferase [Halocynthiibacter sp.]